MVLRRALTVLTSTLAALVVLEAGLRLFPPPLRPVPGYSWMRYDPVYGTVNAPGRYVDPSLGHARVAGTITITRDGLRGDEPTGAPRRILCLGDSSTFGIRLEHGRNIDPDAVFRADNAWPAFLADELRARGVAADVLNAGVIGDNSAHGLRRITGRLRRLFPTTVIVRFGFNDHVFFDAETMVEDTRVLPFVIDLALARPVLALVHHHPRRPAVSVERFVANLEAIAERVREAGGTVLALDYPLRPLAPGETEDTSFVFMGLPPLAALYAEHARYMAALDGLANITVVRTADVVSFGPADRVHPDADGARAIAHRLAAVPME